MVKLALVAGLLFILAVEKSQSVLINGEEDVGHTVSDDKWNAHKKEHIKEVMSAEKEQVARHHFAKTEAYINDHNAKESSYKLKHNHLSHLTPAEVKNHMGVIIENDNRMDDHIDRTKRCSERKSSPRNKRATVPDSIDWRNHNGASYVTPVESQASCGCCYAFACKAVLESRYAITYGADKLVSLSAQNVVDCGELNGLGGCGGGTIRQTFNYAAMMANWPVGGMTGRDAKNLPKTGRGLNTLSAYPYEGHYRKSCDWKAGESNIGAPLNPYCVYKSDEDKANNVGGQRLQAAYGLNDLKTELATYGPVAAAGYIGKKFRNYWSGVLPEDDCEVDVEGAHAIAVVGYGVDPTHGNYWIIKNSWGTRWGEDGYMRLGYSGDGAAIGGGAGCPCGFCKNLMTTRFNWDGYWD